MTHAIARSEAGETGRLHWLFFQDPGYQNANHLRLVNLSPQCSLLIGYHVITPKSGNDLKH
jgi:hypothetical protein